MGAWGEKRIPGRKENISKSQKVREEGLVEGATPELSSATLSGGSDENGINIQVLECQAGCVGLNLEDN